MMRAAIDRKRSAVNSTTYSPAPSPVTSRSRKTVRRVVIALGEHALLRRGEMMSAVRRANGQAATLFPRIP